jgi:cytochrome c biogenesis protein CcdA
MIDAPLALAFAAGLVATVNPCGFAMLPAYLSYFMGLNDESTSRATHVRNALTVGVVVSAGFLLVFGVAGVLITAGFRVVIDLIPWLAIAVGIGIIGLGIAMLWGYQLTIGLPKSKQANTKNGYRSVFAFGVSYAIASLSCTLPVFLTVVATQVTRGTFVGGLATFIAYGAGMSLVLIGITIALAFGKQGLVGWLRNGTRYIGRISGGLLVAAGIYIVWFWGTSLTAGAGALNNAGPFRFVEDLSQRVQNIVASNPLVVAAVLVAVIASGIVAAIVAGRRETRQGVDVLK